ncbi:MAG: hypothetical protein HOV79_20305 [Hamadaea sp.]|nr:hypothetical protein [Hamadaea sp.]
MSAGAAARDFGTGPLSRIIALLYTLLAVQVSFALAAAPAVVLLLLLDRDVSNLPLAALCALPLGPAASAAVWALHHRRADLTDLRPAAAFWLAYKRNARGVLKLWAPWLAFTTVIAVNLAHFDAAGVPGWWAWLLVAVGAAAALWAANALVITSLFAFRTTDVARLAAYFLLRTWPVTLGYASLLIVALGVIYLFSEAVLMLIAVLLLWSLAVVSRPMTAAITREFTA